MDTFNIKTVADATAEFTRKTTMTMTEASTRAWKDFYTFSDAVTKAQADAFKSISSSHGYGEFYDAMSKFQSDAVKNFSSMFNTPASK